MTYNEILSVHWKNVYKAGSLRVKVFAVKQIFFGSKEQLGSLLLRNGALNLRRRSLK